MHTTVDESTGVRDARFTEHTKRSAFILAVHRAFELDGLPMPSDIDFLPLTDHVTFVMDENATGDVDDWARHLGVETVMRPNVFDDGTATAWRTYTTVDSDITWHAYRVRVWCVARLMPGASTLNEVMP